MSVLGKSAEAWKHKLYERVAFIPDISGLDPRLTVRQTIDFPRPSIPPGTPARPNVSLRKATCPATGGWGPSPRA
ncbi:MAG: hypothetical protein U5N26_01565 [Candidatus Marinimicrobia bacterium]|nr:hypothetical protein [Candidatus Neomarinimicrobiota bacterium]